MLFSGGGLLGVSMGGGMEGSVREEWKGEGRARQERGELAQTSFRRVCAHTSLCRDNLPSKVK